MKKYGIFISMIATALLSAPVIAAAPSDGAMGLEISGPIMGGRQGAPFAAPTVDVAEHGYVTEEFFLTGSALSYRFAEGSEQTTDGRWRTESDSEKAAPFRTRILVVRPAKQSDFNGTVVVHWQNVTAGYELGSVGAGEYLRGYAWVGVSAQKVGVDGFPTPEAAGLKQWDPERYGELEHPGDAYSYDIFTQAGRAVGPARSTTGWAKASQDPMGGLRVERLIAAGASQSASRLRTYINGVHPLEKAFDAYLPYIDFASTIPFESDKNGQGRRAGRKPTQIRADLEVPVFVVNSETETQAYLPARQPDTAKFRFWEVAGTAHVSVVRDAANPPGLESPNWLSYTPVYDAAIRRTHEWLTQGKPPRTQPLIEVAEDADGQATIQRDAVGNALGGVRLPDIEAATAVHRGRGTPVAGGNRFAFLYGYAQDLTPKQLAVLYPDRDTYINRYSRAALEAVDSGVLLIEDSIAKIETAKRWAWKNLSAP